MCHLSLESKTSWYLVYLTPPGLPWWFLWWAYCLCSISGWNWGRAHSLYTWSPGGLRTSLCRCCWSRRWQTPAGKTRDGVMNGEMEKWGWKRRRKAERVRKHKGRGKKHCLSTIPLSSNPYWVYYESGWKTENRGRTAMERLTVAGDFNHLLRVQQLGSRCHFAWATAAGKHLLESTHTRSAHKHSWCHWLKPQWTCV